MAVCGACSAALVGDGVRCDGVCGGIFHASCLKRVTRASASGSATCNECSDIKPCHVLRLVKGMFDALSSDHSLLADKFSSFISSFAGLQIFVDDMHAIPEKIDRLLDVTNSLSSDSRLLLERSLELSSRVSNLRGALDDFYTSFAGGDFASLASAAGPSPASPTLDAIRRDIRQVKSDISSWSSTVVANAESIGSIASDVRDLASRGVLVSPPPAPSPPTVVQDGGCLSSDALVPPTANSNTVSPTTGNEPSPDQAPLPSGPSSKRSPSSLDSGKRRHRGRRSRNNVSAITPSVAALTLSEAAVRCPVAPQFDPPASETTASATLSEAAVRCPVAPQIDPPASETTASVDVNAVALSLRPAIPPKCIFVSRIHHKTTEEEIINYLSARLGISRSAVACRMISPKHVQGGRSFTASFRILIPEDYFAAALSPHIWPVRSIVREFVPRNRSARPKAAKNSSAKSQFITPT